MSLSEKLKAVELLVLDCDGVLTNGEIYYDENGVRNLAFYAKDGVGLALLSRQGVKIAVVSGRPTDIAELRFRELGVQHFVGRCHDKAGAVRELLGEFELEPGQAAFVGDDIVDIPGFTAAGVGIAVADASPEVKDAADWVTERDGGRGAVREVCEALLEARGVWGELLQRFTG